MEIVKECRGRVSKEESDVKLVKDVSDRDRSKCIVWIFNMEYGTDHKLIKHRLIMSRVFSEVWEIGICLMFYLI